MGGDNSVVQALGSATVKTWVQIQVMVRHSCQYAFLIFSFYSSNKPQA